MAQKKATPAVAKESDKPYVIFSKDNYLWMLGGIVMIAIGLFLMAGGKSSDPNQFHPDQVYSTTRITIAPILILIGLGLEVFAILRKPKN
jgi:hypothetical protein